jgi:hypothetical protein
MQAELTKGNEASFVSSSAPWVKDKANKNYRKAATAPEHNHHHCTQTYKGETSSDVEEGDDGAQEGSHPECPFQKRTRTEARWYGEEQDGECSQIWPSRLSVAHGMRSARQNLPPLSNPSSYLLVIVSLEPLELD